MAQKIGYFTLDTYTSLAAPDTTYCSANDLYLGADKTDVKDLGEWKTFAYVDFSDAAAIMVGNVDSALIYMYCNTLTHPGAFYTKWGRTTESWDEGANCPTANSLPGFSATPYSEELEIGAFGVGWIYWDVWLAGDANSLVYDAIANRGKVLDARCYWTDTNEGSWLWEAHFNSKDAGTYAPYLVINYTPAGETHEASASIAGAGALAATGRLFLGGSASLVGAGTLIATPRAILAGSAGLAGEGVLTVAGGIGVVHEGAAVLSGEGALSVSGVNTLVGAASLVGEGALSVASVATLKGMASLLGEGVLAVAAKPTLVGIASLAGSGALSVVASPILTGIISMAGAGALSVSALNYCFASASLAGIGALTVSAKCYVPGSVSMSGAGAFEAIGRLTLVGVANLAGEGLLSVIAKPIFVGVISMSGEGSIAPIFVGVLVGAVSMSGMGTLTVDGWIVKAAVVPPGYATGPSNVPAAANVRELL